MGTVNSLLRILIIIAIPYNSFTQIIEERIEISDDIELIKLSDHAYIHVSYLESPNFGRFPSNGMIFINEKQAFLFDTPMTESMTKDLVNWITETKDLEITGFVPNHWHDDCLGGIGYLHSLGVESYANQMTIDLAQEKGFPLPKYGFIDSLSLNPGDKLIQCYYMGAGHAMDNIVVWIPSEKILFAGCMARALNARGLGNTTDADMTEWPKTIEKVINKFSKASIVIPGHGQYGGIELLEHTRSLLGE